jgi:hypothetical protein
MTRAIRFTHRFTPRVTPRFTRDAVALIVVSACALGLAARAYASDRYALIVSGASGSPEVAEQQLKWRATLAKALREKDQLPPDHLIVLSDQPSDGKGDKGDKAAGTGAAGRQAPGAATRANARGAAGARTTPGAKAPAAGAAAQPGDQDAELDSGVPELLATRENVDSAFAKLTRNMKRDDVLLVVLFGHSTFDGVDAKFNLVGPDLEAADWQRLVAAIPGRVVFVNTTGASAPFMQRLAGPGRVIITATDNPAQRYDTIFPEFFAQAFSAPEADLDKDGRISVWEAFAYASAKVKVYYRQRGQLSVERPVLDDTGDGVGKESGELGPDGAVASRTFLDSGGDPLIETSPALSEMINRRNTLESEFDELKRRREFMPAGDYEKQRDILLIDISRISHQIRLEQSKRS